MVFRLGLLLLLVSAILAPPFGKQHSKDDNLNHENQAKFLEHFNNIFGGWGLPDQPVSSKPDPTSQQQKKPVSKPQQQVQEKVESPIPKEQGESPLPNVQQQQSWLWQMPEKSPDTNNVQSQQQPEQKQHLNFGSNTYTPPQQQQNHWNGQVNNPGNSPLKPATAIPVEAPSTTTTERTSSTTRTTPATTKTSTFNEKLHDPQQAMPDKEQLQKQIIDQFNQWKQNNPQLFNQQLQQTQGGFTLEDSQPTNSQLPPQQFSPFPSQPNPNLHMNYPYMMNHDQFNNAQGFGGSGHSFSTPPLPPQAEECHSPEGNSGVCSSAAVCGNTGGEMGEEASSGGCGEGLVCCVRSLRKCGEASKARVTNIKSPHYPGPTNYLRNCPAHLHIHPDTCQVRVDLLDFNIGSMINGRCHIHDSLLLKSTIGAKIPLRRLCGHVSDPKYLPDPTHFYIHIPSPLGDQKHFLPNKKDLLRLLTFDFNVKNSSSSWNIRVTQIPCSGGSELLAPPGCSQYHTETTGSIFSLNFLDKQYPLGTRLDVCIKRSPGDCGIQYYLGKMGVGTTNTGGLGYGLVCDDYIMFRGEKTSLCGRGDGRTLTLPASGPLGFTFNSDERAVDRFDVGYNIAYKTLQDCTGVQFSVYPEVPWSYRRTNNDEDERNNNDGDE